MTTERNFRFGCEPSELEPGRSSEEILVVPDWISVDWSDEGGFRQTHFLGDGLLLLVGNIPVQKANGGRIAGWNMRKMVLNSTDIT